jgi:Ca2+/Na+ antiporter
LMKGEFFSVKMPWLLTMQWKVKAFSLYKSHFYLIMSSFFVLSRVSGLLFYSCCIYFLWYSWSASFQLQQKKVNKFYDKWGQCANLFASMPNVVKFSVVKKCRRWREMIKNYKVDLKFANSLFPLRGTSFTLFTSAPKKTAWFSERKTHLFS